MTHEVRIKRTLNADVSIPLPEYATDGSVGVDLRANLLSPQRIEGYTLYPGRRVVVPTGLMIALPDGMEAQVRGRSGLAVKHGVTVLNSPGTIDTDYRGEIGVILINQGQEDFLIVHGERIAQMIFSMVEKPTFSPVLSLDDTDRGTGGFGSTGTK